MFLEILSVSREFCHLAWGMCVLLLEKSKGPPSMCKMSVTILWTHVIVIIF